MVFALWTGAGCGVDHGQGLDRGSETVMKTLVDQLSQYADYHRDGRNILTHFVGVPMILWAVVILLSRPGVGAGGQWLGAQPRSAGRVGGLGVRYVLLDTRYGISLAMVLALMLAAGAWLAQQTLSLWLDRRRPVCGGLDHSVCWPLLGRAQTRVHG